MNQIDKKFIVIDFPIEDLVFDKANPNKMTETQMIGLIAAIKHQKFNQPIIIMRHELDKKGVIKRKNRNMIADGEHRAIACQRIGMKTISALYYDMTEGMRLLIRQTHNKTKGEHDAELDSVEFKLMKKLGIDKLLKVQTSMSDEEFEKIIKWGTEKAIENQKVEFEIHHSCPVVGCSHGN